MGCAPLVQVNVGLFADKVGVTTANTLDLGQGVHDLALAINVGVEETKNVLHSVSISLQRQMRELRYIPGTAGGPRGRGGT